MPEKWTKEEFLSKISFEGFDYAFNGYGLSVEDLEDVPEDLIRSQERYQEARGHFEESLCNFLGVKDLSEGEY